MRSSWPGKETKEVDGSAAHERAESVDFKHAGPTKFRISSLLWLTLAVACFFAGMHWDDFYEQLRLVTKPGARQISGLLVPTDREVFKAVASSGYALPPQPFNLVRVRLSDYVDPPRSGQQVRHVRYKCTVVSPDLAPIVVYVEKSAPISLPQTIRLEDQIR